MSGDPVSATLVQPAGRRDFVGVRTEHGRVIHWFEGESFNGVWSLRTVCGMSGDFAVDRDGGDFGTRRRTRLDDYCARCDRALFGWFDS